jgi:SsrA-binding protein
MAIKIIAKHKRAGYDYFLLEKMEAGMVLKGSELKSLRNSKVSIAECFISINEDEIFANNITIPLYEFSNINNHSETRKRKLLLHKKEIEYLAHQMKIQGATLIPTMIYFKNSYVKLEIALAKGKKQYDKRADAQKKDVERKLRQGQY